MQRYILFVLYTCSLTIANANSVINQSSKYKTPNHSKAVRIKSNADAVRLLTQLGYNQCENRTDLKSNNQNEILCQSSMESMLKRFQTMFDLPVTGKLDAATLKLMNRPRCHSFDSSSSSSSTNMNKLCNIRFQAPKNMSRNKSCNLQQIQSNSMLKEYQQKKTSTIPFGYRYLLSVPPCYESEKPQKRWPLLLFLHGAGESHGPIDKVLIHGPPKLVHAYSLNKQSNRSIDYVNMECAQLVAENFVTCSPQVDRGYGWNSTVLSALLDELEQTYRVDRNRIYVTGISMGGYGTWSLAMAQPTRFAAIIPICGGGDHRRVSVLKNLPIWNFHGQLDDVIPVEASLSLIRTLNSSLCKSTIYPNLLHDSWTVTYNNPEVFQWLLKQNKDSYNEIVYIRRKSFVDSS